MIGDGYDFTKTIGSLKIVYRPMLTPELIRTLHVAAHIGGTQGPLYIFDSAAKHIVHWSLDVPINWESLEEIDEQDGELFKKIWRCVAGIDDGNWEASSAENLRKGLLIMVKQPRLGKISCKDCQKYWTDESGNGGQLVLSRTTRLF